LGQVKKNEIETWMPSREKYSETHSCSSLYDYQARRSQIRYRDESGEMKYCYTLNNTMAASPRLLIPILEHYQNEDGTVTVPEALRPYMYGMEVIEPV
jgi:seryl-tRNA synthetase